LGLNDDECCGRCARDIQELADLATRKLALPCSNSSHCRY
jgi:hypothetical protein